jgi:hypothetical protein
MGASPLPPQVALTASGWPPSREWVDRTKLMGKIDMKQRLMLKNATTNSWLILLFYFKIAVNIFLLRIA